MLNLDIVLFLFLYLTFFHGECDMARAPSPDAHAYIVKVRVTWRGDYTPLLCMEWCDLPSHQLHVPINRRNAFCSLCIIATICSVHS